jgi:hypothetical protein
MKTLVCPWLGLCLLTIFAVSCGEDPAESGSPGGPQCPAGQTLCDSGCVDLNTNSANCGACSVACGTGSACVNGQCMCQAGLVACAGQCVDTSSNPAHCGTCDNACDAGLVCSGGQCLGVCPVGSTQCGQSCVDLQTNPFHCGACDNACPGGQSCNGGLCECPAGQTACGGGCVDVQTDPYNCGGCGVQCAAGQSCEAGSCVGGTEPTGTGGSSQVEEQSALAQAQANLTGDIVFTPPSSTFQGQLTVQLSSEMTNAEIHYTTDGAEPTASSTLYSGSAVSLSTTTQIRAQAFIGTEPAGAPGTAVYIARSFDTSVDLPIILIDTYGSGELPTGANERVFEDAAFMAFEAEGGAASLSATPSIATRSGIHIRGQSTAMFEKKPYRVELWDNQGLDADWPLLGMPAESDWALRGPFADKALIRDPFVYSLGRDMGMQAPRWAYCEAYINLDGGAVGEDDYEGVYVIVETMKNSQNRLDLSQLRADDPVDIDPNQANITGGYIFKFEWMVDQQPNEYWIDGNGWSEVEVVDPNPLDPNQATWLTNYIQGFHDLLHAADFADPANGYPSKIDMASFVDQLIINELTREMDSYIRSAVFYKDRDSRDPRLYAGPLWDYNLIFGVGGFFENDQAAGWQYEQERSNMNTDWFPVLVTDPAFMDQVAARWQQLRQSLLSDAQIDARIQQLTAPLVNAAGRNFQRWPNLSDRSVEMFQTPTAGTWEGQVQFMRDWIAERIAWLDTQWQ